jgi:hypothetical protein
MSKVIRLPSKDKVDYDKIIAFMGPNKQEQRFISLWKVICVLGVFGFLAFGVACFVIGIAPLGVFSFVISLFIVLLLWQVNGIL